MIAGGGADPRDWLAAPDGRAERLRAVIGPSALIWMRLIVESVGPERQGRATITAVDDDPLAHGGDAPAGASGVPVITALTAMRRVSGPDGFADVTVTVAPAVPAESVLIGYTEDGTSWVLGLETTGLTASVPVTAAATTVRAAAVAAYRGSWVTSSLTAQAGTTPDAPGETIPGYYAEQASVSVSTGAVAGATGYEWTLLPDGDAVPAAIRVTVEPALWLGRAALGGYGGPWRALTVECRSIDGTNVRSAASAVDLANTAPAAPTGIFYTNGDVVSWNAAPESDVVDWRVESSWAPPVVVTEPLVGVPSPSFSWEITIRARDRVGTGAGATGGGVTLSDGTVIATLLGLVGSAVGPIEPSIIWAGRHWYDTSDPGNPVLKVRDDNDASWINLPLTAPTDGLSRNILSTDLLAIIEIDRGVDRLRVAGETGPGQGPEVEVVRVAAEPAHRLRVRSADRELPAEAGTDPVNGGWWALEGTRSAGTADADGAVWGLATAAAIEERYVPRYVVAIGAAFYAGSGDGCGGGYVRVAIEPAHMGKRRSLDRNMPDGTGDAANGGWWEMLPNPGGVAPEQYGATADGTADDRAAISTADAMGYPLRLGRDSVYRVASDITIAQDLIARGGVLKPDSGATITIDGHVDGRFAQIFDLSAGGTVILSKNGRVRCRNEASIYNSLENCRIQGGAIGAGSRRTSTKISLRYTGNEAAAGSVEYHTYYNSAITCRFAEAYTHIQHRTGDGAANRAEPNANEGLNCQFGQYTIAVDWSGTVENSSLGGLFHNAPGAPACSTGTPTASTMTGSSAR